MSVLYDDRGESARYGWWMGRCCYQGHLLASGENLTFKSNWIKSEEIVIFMRELLENLVSKAILSHGSNAESR